MRAPTTAQLQAFAIVNALGNVADNMLNGMNQGLSPGQFLELLAKGPDGECFFLDCREPDNAEPYLARHPASGATSPRAAVRAPG